jgi:hypothetical protein
VAAGGTSGRSPGAVWLGHSFAADPKPPQPCSRCGNRLRIKRFLDKLECVRSIARREDKRAGTLFIGTRPASAFIVLD